MNYIIHLGPVELEYVNFCNIKNQNFYCLILTNSLYIAVGSKEEPELGHGPLSPLWLPGLIVPLWAPVACRGAGGAVAPGADQMGVPILTWQPFSSNFFYRLGPERPPLSACHCISHVGL